MKKIITEPRKLSTSIDPLKELATEKTIFWILKKEGGIRKKATIEKVKKGAGEKLDQLFLVNDSDSDTKKYLKSQATKEAFPRYIDEGLKKENPPLTLNDLKRVDEKGLEKFRQELKLIGTITKFNDLIPEFQNKIIGELKAAKEKAKKENLTPEEKDKIDKAANKQELDNIVANNISSKNKLEELIVTDEDIEKALGSLKLPKNFVENAKQILRKKRRELTPEPTTAEGKIKELLI
nr:1251_t:CDS:2 [Entrophospora candida]